MAIVGKEIVDCEFGRGKTIIDKQEIDQITNPNSSFYVCKAAYCPIIECLYNPSPEAEAYRAYHFGKFGY